MIKLINENNEYIDELYKIINNDKGNYNIFTDEFSLEMASVSCVTLKNINDIVLEYLKSFETESSRGEKILLIFGLLQGLFAAIDSLYSLGKATNLNKLLISINQNEILKEIKRVRNDVVGHPSYRFYNNNLVGYCLLDIDNITSSKITYHCFSNQKNNLVEKEKSVDMLEVVTNYYIEANKIIEKSKTFLELKNKSIEFSILKYVVQIFNDYQKGIKNYNLIEKVKKEYSFIMGIEFDENNRILWRLNNIKYMFDIVENEYIKHLTSSEIKKLYLLLYNFEKQIDPDLKVVQLKYNKSFEIQLFKKKSIKLVKYNYEVLKDIDHDLYNQTILDLLDSLEKDNKLTGLINWIRKLIQNNDKILLYAIGSELQINNS